MHAPEVDVGERGPNHIGGPGRRRHPVALMSARRRASAGSLHSALAFVADSGVA